ncbi:MAG: ABC transporter substrate-binding protein [bacterium]|nr:ABC transporter substrate-binding protein [bacterium]
MSKFPSFSQWKQIFKVLKKWEKVALAAFVALAILSFTFLTIDLYITNTKVAPALGGTYTEGIVGQPRFINPIYGETNDVDRTLIDLVFSSLVTYDKNGQISNDLAETYTVSPDGKTYEFTLKDNIFWHDGKALTPDDIVFTIKTIQNSDYKSPLRANWIDVDVQKTSEKSVTFTLKTPYNSFLENLTVKILPKHTWESISPENFSLSAYNLQPIGSGPFIFENLRQTNTGFIKTLQLASNRKYYNKPAFISTLVFQFFEKKEELVRAASSKAIDGFSLASLENNQLQAEREIKQGWLEGNRFETYSFSLPRYFAVFFNNQKSSVFADENLRKALSSAVNKEELVKKIKLETKNNILTVDSPILPDFFNYQPPTAPYHFDVDATMSLLDKTGYKENVNGQREKTTIKQPAFQFKSYLKVGAKGTEVTELQKCLARLAGDSFGSLLGDETTGTYGTRTENAVTEFQKKYLPDLKPTGETGASTRQKLNELCVPPSQNSQLLKFTLTTINQPQLLQIANSLKQYWENIGVLVEIRAVSIVDLKPIIKNRSYDALLYGEALGARPDLYPFWHSSQKVDPGLNLSAYENKEVDLLLKEARETLDENVKKQKYEKMQNIILNNAPALFLYNPSYIYWVSEEVQSVDTIKIIDPAKRFSNITNWYIKTKRTWK